jgi:MFS family permease
VSLLTGHDAKRIVLTVPQPVFTIDKVGRKPFLIIGSIGQAVCFFIVAGVFANLPPESSPSAHTYGIVIVSFIYIYFAFFSSCWLGPSWMYGPEILPLKGRSHGMGLAVGKRLTSNAQREELT